MYVNQMWGHRLPTRHGWVSGHIDRPAWADIEAAIRELDGRKAITVELFRIPPERFGYPQGDEDYDLPHMAVSGGHGGRYTAYISKPDAPTRMLAGRPGEPPDGFSKGPDLEAVVQAARRFTTDGEADEALPWCVAE